MIHVTAYGTLGLESPPAWAFTTALKAVHQPTLAPIRAIVRRILSAHEPFPALAVDGEWTMLDANAGVGVFLVGLDPALLTPPVNVLRLTLHPGGLAPRIVNLGQWRGHVLNRLERQITATGSPALAELYSELAAYPVDRGFALASVPDADVPAVPMRLRHDGHELALLSVTSVFGTPRNVTTAELAVESFFPADAATRTALTALVG
ncbi:transcriptional regulator [Nocardia higoensis]|nr:transcriptional regulator [Nocardia higoensis]